ncbi:MAG: DUF4238 domain-containing protein [Myxococcales bacterium]|nr:DUF4238 domain-containing protein [Myxococcales bacterium]
MIGRRRHHFVPACYLANFTPGGDRDSTFHAVDLTTGAARPTTPNNEGWRRGFYNVDVDGEDLELVENTFAKVEGHIAPILQEVATAQRLPEADEDMGSLLYFMALQLARTPRMRAGFTQMNDAVMRQVLRASAETQAAFEASLAAFSEDTRREVEGLTREDVLEAAKTGRFDYDQTTHVQTMLEVTEGMFPYFTARSWSILASPPLHPEFITSDCPVTAFPLAGSDPWPGPVGVGLRHVAIIFPISPRTAMLGVARPGAAVVQVPSSTVAAINGAICIAAERFVWGRRPRFLYMLRGNTFREPSHLTTRAPGSWSVWPER